MLELIHKHAWVKHDGEYYRCQSCSRGVSSAALLAWLIGQNRQLLAQPIHKVSVERYPAAK